MEIQQISAVGQKSSCKYDAPVMGDLEFLRFATLAARKMSFCLDDRKGCCVYAAGGLQYALNFMGFHAECVRTEVVVRSESHDVSVTCGDPWPTERWKSEPGMWNGHLIVIAGGQYLLDPTLDQFERDGLELGVVALEVPDVVLDGSESLYLTGESFPDLSVQTTYPGNTDLQIRYRLHPKLNGWKTAGAFRKTFRKELGEAIIGSMLLHLNGFEGRDMPEYEYDAIEPRVGEHVDVFTNVV